MINEEYKYQKKFIGMLVLKFSGIEVTIDQDVKILPENTNVRVRGDIPIEVKNDVLAKSKAFFGNKLLGYCDGQELIKQIGERLVTVRCECCKGKGGWHGFQNGDHEMSWVTCHICGGTGVSFKSSGEKK